MEKIQSFLYGLAVFLFNFSFLILFSISINIMMDWWLWGGGGGSELRLWRTAQENNWVCDFFSAKETFKKLAATLQQRFFYGLFGQMCKNIIYYSFTGEMLNKEKNAIFGCYLEKKWMTSPCARVPHMQPGKDVVGPIQHRKVEHNR